MNLPMSRIQSSHKNQKIRWLVQQNLIWNSQISYSYRKGQFSLKIKLTSQLRWARHASYFLSLNGSHNRQVTVENISFFRSKKRLLRTNINQVYLCYRGRANHTTKINPLIFLPFAHRWVNWKRWLGQETNLIFWPHKTTQSRVGISQVLRLTLNKHLGYLKLNLW